MVAIPKKRLLKGRKADGTIDFGPSGNDAARNAIFPIICLDEEKLAPDLLGTGFYITHNGIFITAKHCLMHAFDETSMQQNKKRNVRIVHLFPEGGYTLRPILNFSIPTQSNVDITVGLAAPMKQNTTGKNLYSNFCKLSLETPKVNDDICTWAYPASNILAPEMWKGDNALVSLHADFYDGKIIEQINEHKIQTNMHIHGGASGGPVFSRAASSIIGVNSSSFAGETDLSFITPIHHILDLSVGPIILSGEKTPQKICINELIDRGLITIKK